MNDTEGLAQQVALLAAREWRVAKAATEALIAAGADGVAAVVEGLRHPEPRLRRRCADFLDHHADDVCVEDLRRVATEDPVPSVRRAAVHALGCVACKPVPLAGDFVDFLAAVACNEDESWKVRRAAIGVLGQQADNARVVPTLKLVLEREPHPELRKRAHQVLRLHDPDYRRLTDVLARQASVARARA